MKGKKAIEYLENRLKEYALPQDKISFEMEKFKKQYSNLDTFFQKSWLDWKCQKIIKIIGKEREAKK